MEFIMLQLPERYSTCSQVLEKHANPKSILYHYTDWSGLLGILQSKQLWLTDYTQLNDTSEIQYALKRISNYILNTITDTDDIKIFWEKLLDDSHNVFLKYFDFFICSFCKEKNHLYAWRSYANDGAGFSIGFRSDFFNGSNELPKKENKLPNFGRSEVFYDYEILNTSIDSLINVVREDLLKEKALCNTENAAKKRYEITIHFLSALLPFISSIKHKAYEGEREFRIYSSIPKFEEYDQKFFTSGNNPTSPHHNSKKRIYFNFDLKNISEIWVGPRLNFDHAKYDIQEIIKSLKENGNEIGEIEIISSGIPYKNH